jgi:O-antigen biosynthesis protein
MNINVHNVLFYGSWHIPYQRPHHFAHLFERYGLKTCVLTKKSIFKEHPQEFEYKNVCSSLRYIRDFPRRFLITEELSRRFTGSQERTAFRELADGIPAIIYCVPNVCPVSAKPLIFDCIDDFAVFGNTRDVKKDRLQFELAGKADVIWATSNILYERWHKVFPEKTHLISNGADVGHFASAIGFSPEPNRTLLAGKKALVSYCGAIANWFDCRLVINVARMLPWVQFVLAGPISLNFCYDWPENISLLGAQPYTKLPEILKECDCCIIPFVINELTAATNPIKLFEYFACGKPVVSTPLPEVQQYRRVGVLESAETAEEFAVAIERCIELSWCEDLVKQRLLIARNNSWEVRFECAYKTMQPFL